MSIVYIVSLFPLDKALFLQVLFRFGMNIYSYYIMGFAKTLYDGSRMLTVGNMHTIMVEILILF